MTTHGFGRPTSRTEVVAELKLGVGASRSDVGHLKISSYEHPKCRLRMVQAGNQCFSGHLFVPFGETDIRYDFCLVHPAMSQAVDVWNNHLPAAGCNRALDFSVEAPKIWGSPGNARIGCRITSPVFPHPSHGCVSTCHINTRTVQ
jgi:hypothetical protein